MRRCIVCACLLLAVPFACHGAVSISVARVMADSGAKSGFIPISVADSTFSGFDITLTYDNTVFEVIPGWYHPGTGEVVEAARTPLSSQFVIRVQRTTSGRTTTLRIAGSSERGITDATGLFLRLGVNITGAPGEQTPIRFSAAKFVDAQGNQIQAAVSDGAVFVNRWPSISRAPENITAVCRSGNNPPDQMFEVWNTGGGTLNFRVVSTVPWLSCSPAVGSSDGNRVGIAVQFRATGLLQGTYTGAILISDANADNNPQEVSVTLTVYPRLVSIVPH